MSLKSSLIPKQPLRSKQEIYIVLSLNEKVAKAKQILKYAQQ